MAQPTAWIAATAPRACTTCKKRKRACDKQIPMCSSCKWLQTHCQYEVPTVSASPMNEPYPAQAHQDTLPWMHWFLHVGKETNSIANDIQNYATSLFGTSQHLDSTIQSYFSRIHPWLPFISRPRFYQRLSSLAGPSDYSFVLLSCVMFLVLAIPTGQEAGTHRSTLCKDIKRLLTLAECEGPPGLDLIHCRLLVALYEINHGATDEAYMSLGVCARVGIVLGLDRHMQWRQNGTDQRSWPQSEEERRTWWATIILDRFLRQQRPLWPAAVRDPSSSDILPMDDLEWDRTRQMPTVRDHGSTPLLVSTASHIRVGYFARLAQVSHLLGLALNNKYNPTPDTSFNAQESDQLRRTLATYAELLPKEATAVDCSHYCGPILICMSAQLVLEQEDASGFNAATESLTATMIEMGKDLNLELASVGPELLRPLALFAIYQASKMYTQQLSISSDPKYVDGIRVLLQSLRYFDERWRLAGVYKAEILGDLGRLGVKV